MLSEAVTAQYLALIRDRLARYRQHPQYEDLQSEATLHVLKALSRLPPEEREGAPGLVWTVAGHGAVEFFQSPRNEYRTDNGAGFRPRARLELDGLNANERELFLGHVPDFAPPLIEQLAAEELWRQFFRSLPRRDRPVLLRYLTGGETGTTAAGSEALRRKLARRLRLFRRELGLPAPPREPAGKTPVDVGRLTVAPEDADLIRDWEWFEREGQPGMIYRAIPGQAGHGQCFLAWEIVRRRDGTGRGKEVVRFANGNPADFRRENLRRVSDREQKREAYRALSPAERGNAQAKHRAWLAQHQEEQNRRAQERYHRLKARRPAQDGQETRPALFSAHDYPSPENRGGTAP